MKEYSNLKCYFFLLCNMLLLLKLLYLDKIIKFYQYLLYCTVKLSKFFSKNCENVQFCVIQSIHQVCKILNISWFFFFEAPQIRRAVSFIRSLFVDYSFLFVSSRCWLGAGFVFALLSLFSSVFVWALLGLPKALLISVAGRSENYINSDPLLVFWNRILIWDCSSVLWLVRLFSRWPLID